MRRSGRGTQTTSIRPRQLGVDRRPTCPVSWGGRSTGFSRVLNGSPAWGAADAAPQWKFTSYGGVGLGFVPKGRRTTGVVKKYGDEKGDG